jgi:hypothetical protein
MTIAEIKKLAHEVIAEQGPRGPTNATVLGMAILELLDGEDPEEELLKYAGEINDLNDLLDEVEALCADDSIDVELADRIKDLLKRKRPPQ